VDYNKLFSEYALSMRVSDIRELLKVVETGRVISLAGGLPDPRTFPKEEIASIAKYVVENYGDKALQYSPTRGVKPLLDAIKDFSKRQGVRVREDDGIIVTVGSQQGLYLLALSIIDPGDYIVTEEPSYLGMIQAFSARKTRFITIPIDEHGMKTELLEDAIKRTISSGGRVKAIYTVPTCHNPAGTTMPMERRKELLEVAEKYDLLVIEDDPYSVITFEKMNVEYLKSIDRSGRVVYLSTISKILAPGLRVGWSIGPEPVISKMELVKQAVDLHTPTFPQYIVAEAMNRGVIDSHIPFIKAIYREKRDTILNAFEEYMVEGTKWTKPIGGLFVWTWFPEWVNSRKLLEIAIKNGVVFVPGDSFYPNGGGYNTARINYSFPSKEELIEGVKRLATSLRELKSTTS